MKKKILIYPILFLGLCVILSACKKDNKNNNNDTTPVPIPGPNVTDIDGNVYHSVIIGTQTWTVENLKVSKYRDGTDIPYIKDSVIWNRDTTGAYCEYDTSASNSIIYGKLYNWYAIKSTHNICPSGWHIPSYDEWQILISYCGYTLEASSYLMETGTSHWPGPNTYANNETGFTALPAGYRDANGAFINIGYNGNWWSSTEDSINYSYLYFMDQTMIYDWTNRKFCGLSVRLVKD